MESKESLLKAYILNKRRSFSIIKVIDTIDRKKLKEKVNSISEKEKKIKASLNKLGYQVYFDSSTGKDEIRSISKGGFWN